MAASTLYDTFSINESDAQKIISTPKTKLPESNTFNDLKLKTPDRISHAAKILNSRK
ncbi:hypothetical protein [Peribacillus cavernae]|uniref:hypothetical protein n=1 Tax=Peribacillus cavernae TaxID=1674310 RepID=UPI00163CEE19|nr:hypothetical protein [Peribacillus cavernae]MDQ0221433.1 hypothetical protein [Peribacillus cavernae]